MTLTIDIVPGADYEKSSERIPGQREAGMLTMFGPDESMRIIRDEPSTMDAATIAERQREGGGAPSQRRPARKRSLWQGLGHGLLQLLMTTRAILAVRTNHV
jgi:hypothetical protein